MKIIPTTGLALAVLAGPAVADCFDQSALTRGLTVRYDNSDFTTIRRTGDGYQQIDEFYDAGDSMMRFRAHRGVYFVEEYEPGPDGAPIDGTGLIIEFPVDPATLPTPAAGVEWTGETVNIFDDGTRRPEVATVGFVAAPSINLSGCDYEVLRTNVHYDWGDEGWLRLRYAYLPAIGTALLLSSQFDGEDPFTYTPVALEQATK
ncbi:hypothetical protein [Flavimaricola marinus]|uniref:Uncharacterized protein n=1 Tax=Flavimaricola marinus TaxID=1819565 RepID=A0A238LFV9_9RHOB|nr:hypothetical protein [Flavimaricola marinus]SMY07846.1 hypothetical protein LOM8899_01986 [Flavimaricola marinus]